MEVEGVGELGRLAGRCAVPFLEVLPSAPPFAGEGGGVVLAGRKDLAPPSFCGELEGFRFRFAMVGRGGAPLRCESERGRWGGRV